MTVIYAVILLGVLIFVHELGHFLFAKLLRVKVLKFSLGFGPKVFGRTVGETEYLLSAVPLGGYVKMLGEEPDEELDEADKQRAFSRQALWKRLSIVVFGPIFNLFFAAFIFFFIFLRGVPYLMPEVGEVVADSPAAKAELAKGDRIVEIDGTPIVRWDEMTSIIHKNPEKGLAIKIRRGESVIDVRIAPQKKVIKDIFGQDKEVGLIGIAPSGATAVRKESVPGALAASVTRTWDISVMTLVSIVKLIQRIIPADTIGGPIMIVQMANQQASQGVMSFFTFMALISINLGVLNLLPIPVLDGGHVMFLLIEGVRHKPLSEKVISTSQRIGLALLITLMVFAVYNDIGRLISGKQIP